MATLAIRGHETRGKEVIEILEMLGGNNKRGHSAGYDNLYYFFDKSNNAIDYGYVKYLYKAEDALIFTLEEFLEKFPYKVGDKVSSKYLKNYEVSKMEWESANNRVIYKLQGMGWYSADELQPYKEETIDNTNKVIFEANAQCCDIMNDIIKEETMKEKLEQITLDIPNGYEFFGIDDNNKIVLTKKQLQYPKTYEECCEILSIPSYYKLKYSTYEHNYHEYTTSKKLCLLQDNLNRLGKLLICRDAYWKIAGDWRPEFRFGKKKYCIMTKDNKVISATVEETNRIFVFPTEEMRDAFLGNFKKEIEECKELL